MRAGLWALVLIAAVGCKKKQAPEDEDGAAQHFDDKRGAGADGEKLYTPDDEDHTPTDEQPIEARNIHVVFKETGTGGEATTEIWSGNHGATVVVVRRADKDRIVVWHEGQAMAWTNGDNKLTRSKKKPAVTRLSVLGDMNQRRLAFQGFQRKENEEVAGRDCKVWRNDRVGVTVWNWQGIDLKYVKGDPSNPSHASEAIELEEDATIPAEYLQPPEGYEE